MSKKLHRYKVCLSETRYIIVSKNVHFCLKELMENEQNDVLRFVYYKIPQLRLALRILVLINFFSTIAIIWELIIKIKDGLIIQKDFLTILLFAIICIVIQVGFIIMLEKGKNEFDELKSPESCLIP